MEKKKSTLSYPLNSSNTEELKNLVLKLNGLILSQYLESLMRWMHLLGEPGCRHAASRRRSSPLVEVCWGGELPADLLWKSPNSASSGGTVAGTPLLWLVRWHACPRAGRETAVPKRCSISVTSCAAKKKGLGIWILNVLKFNASSGLLALCHHVNRQLFKMSCIDSLYVTWGRTSYQYRTNLEMFQNCLSISNIQKPNSWFTPKPPCSSGGLMGTEQRFELLHW